MKYFYKLYEEEKNNIGADYSSANAAVVKGERIQVALVHKEQGTGSRLHTHPNEQFNYVLKGTMRAKVNEEVKVVEAGELVHIPKDTPHYMVAVSEDGADYYVSKDTTWGIAGTAVDGKKTGAHYDPGFSKNGRQSYGQCI